MITWLTHIPKMDETLSQIKNNRFVLKIGLKHRIILECKMFV
jgi:hypothetical protein